jgi:hypothetical protein
LEIIDRRNRPIYGLVGMGHRLFILSILSLALLGGPATAQDVPGRYVWPIKGYTSLSAGFCDFRTRHYHGGIDISTNSQEGLPVCAADSGWVGRVSVGYWGFGKAVYIRMADGRMAVYGHLSELSQKIQAYVEDEQYKSRRYQQNLNPEIRQIPIARGEVIGKSGQTGAGPPHLHFEIRTSDNRPLNPLAFFDKGDAIKPAIYSVTISPLQPAALEEPPSTVDGSFLPKTYAVQKGTLVATPHITGAVGISVLADDHIDAPRWTMSAYRHRLIVNGTTIGEVRYDSINYDDTRQIEIERRYDPDGGLSPRAVNLFRRERNTLWHYHGFENDGILSTESSLVVGTNTIRIEVEDWVGNRAAAEFTVSLESAPVSGALVSSPAPIGSMPAWGGMILVVASTSSVTPDIALDPEGIHPIVHWVKGKGGWQAWLPAAIGADALWVRRRSDAPRSAERLGWKPIQSRDGGLLTSDDGKATVSFAAGDIYEAGVYSLTTGSAGGKSRALTRLYTLAPRDIPFARDLRLNIDIPKTTIPVDKLAIYRGFGGSWSFEGQEREKGWLALRATIKSVGSFAILADQTAPVIADVTPGKDAVIAHRRPTIRFQASDNLSGIGSEEDLQMIIDGRWVPVEYDPDLGAAKARPRWDLDPGVHRVEIVARDRCGNEARFERRFTITR